VCVGLLVRAPKFEPMVLGLVVGGLVRSHLEFCRLRTLKNGGEETQQWGISCLRWGNYAN